MPWKSSIGAKCFPKVEILVEISKISKISKIWKKSREALLLYELSEREPGWRFTARCHWGSGALLGRSKRLEATLRVPRAGTRLTVHRSIAIRKQWLSRADLGSQKMVNHRGFLSSYQGFSRPLREKCTENLVQRMVQINMDVIKYEKHNVTTRPVIFLNFRKLWKMRISRKK